jgi:hypothetical protein
VPFQSLQGWARTRWEVVRWVRAPFVAGFATVRCFAFLFAEALNEKTCVSIYALNVIEENQMRGARAHLARWLGMDRLSEEEYLVLSVHLVAFYVARRDNPMTKSEACRLITGRRRFRP